MSYGLKSVFKDTQRAHLLTYGASPLNLGVARSQATPGLSQC